MNLSDTQLFRGIGEGELAALLDCLGAQKRSYPKGGVILSEGDTTERLGIVLDGRAMIVYHDVWGNSSILGNIAPGSTFAEAYACIPGQPLLVTVFAAEDTTVMFLNVRRVVAACANACPFHARLTQNLLSVCAGKNLQLSQKIQHTSAKTIRGRLMSYFSECAKRAGSSSFLVPYNRQQLADYLGVDRSALCSELSKMRRDKLIEYEGNRFLLTAGNEPALDGSRTGGFKPLRSGPAGPPR